jgi:hypothetical protein
LTSALRKQTQIGEIVATIELPEMFRADLRRSWLLFPSFRPQVILAFLFDRGGLIATRQGKIGSLQHPSQAGDVATHKPAGIFIRQPSLPQALRGIVDRAFSHFGTSVK